MTLREDIMNIKIEDFETDMTYIVDEIEQRVNDIAERLAINSVTDLVNIEEAQRIAKALARELY